MPTIRISDEAYKRFMEIKGLMQVKKLEPVSVAEAVDRVLFLFLNEKHPTELYVLEEKAGAS